MTKKNSAQPVPPSPALVETAPAAAPTATAAAAIEASLPELDPNAQLAERTNAPADLAAGGGVAQEVDPMVQIYCRQTYTNLVMGPNTYSFEKGGRYRVPFSVADHLRQIGVI